MNSIDRNVLPSPDRIWFGSLAGIAGLILICVITMLVGPRACGNTGIRYGRTDSARADDCDGNRHPRPRESPHP